CPDAPAVEHDGRTINYGELNGKANRLANYLRAMKVGAEVPVGLCVERSVEMVVALLAIFKSGGVYVPLDATYPDQRLAFMLEDTRAAVVISEQSLLDKLPGGDAKVVCLDRDREEIGRFSDEDPGVEVHPETAAYVIYTSGSTGQPKGVCTSYGSAANHFLAAKEAFGLTASDRVLQFAS